jgi:predicted dehydrogenase
MNVLIIGLGSIAHKHIYALRALSDKVNIYALRSGINATKTEGVTDIHDLDDVKIVFDFAIIANPTSSHYSTITQLLSFHIPLFIEKPLFHTLENGEALIQQCIEANIATYVACNLRFHPCLRFMKTYLDNNTKQINEVNIYSGSYLPDWRPQRDFRTIYSAIPELGGGVHLDLIHELDYAYWLFGTPDHHQKILTNHSSLKIDSIDFAHYNLLYKSFTANITVNYYRKHTKRELEILLEEDTINVNLIANTVTKNGELIFEQKTDIYYTYVEQMKYFLSALHKKEALMNNIQEAFKVLKICLQ